MAYSAGNPPRQIAAIGLYAPQGIGSEISKGGSVWIYVSSDASTQVGGVSGYFALTGRQPSSGATQGVLAHAPIGLGGGDLVAVVQSSAGVTPGLVTWHAVIASTFSQASTLLASAFSTAAGFNVTVSTAASS